MWTSTFCFRNTNTVQKTIFRVSTTREQMLQNNICFNRQKGFLFLKEEEQIESESEFILENCQMRPHIISVVGPDLVRHQESPIYESR